MLLETILFAAPASVAATLVAALAGLLIGSFLNGVARRLPIMAQRELENYLADEAGKEWPHQDRFNLLTPRSRCPHCGHATGLLAMIPVLGWLLVRGKCAACKAPLPARDPIVEAVSVIVSAAVVWHFGSGWPGLALLGALYLAIPILLIKLDTKQVPDDLVHPLIWLGLLINLNWTFAPLHDAVLSAALGYLALWVLNFVLEALGAKTLIDDGYLKLAAAVGAWIGWIRLPVESLGIPALAFFTGPGNVTATVIAALFGLLIGSFLNVVVHRLPIMSQRELDNYIAHQAGAPLPHQDRFNLSVPRSRCPHCGHQIGALENIPLVSWLVLRGKCSRCKAPISARYPVVEAVSGILSATLVWHFGSGWLGLAALGFTWLLLAMTLIDYDTKTLPDVLTFPLLWLGLLINLDGAIVPLHDAVIGAAAGYLALWGVYWLFKLATGKEGMGYGDFKLLAGLGAWMGWTMLPTIVILSSVVGAVIGLSLILFRGRARDNPIPFGPYLAGAGMIALFYGIPLTRLAQGFLQA